MERSALSSKIVLISAESPNLVNGLKKFLLRESCKIFTATNFHESVANAIVVEPDFILIEVTPLNFSGLQISETLHQIKGFNKIPYIFIMAEKKFRGSFKHKIDPIHFLDDQEFPILLTKMKAVLSPRIPLLDPFESGPARETEQDILDKLGQLGIIRKK